jgi:hypothetical protein
LEAFSSPLQGQVVLSCGKYFKQLKTQLAIFLRKYYWIWFKWKGLEALFLFCGYLGIVICCDKFNQNQP